MVLAFGFADIRTLCLSLWNEWAAGLSFGLALGFIALVHFSSEWLAKKLKRSPVTAYLASLIAGAVVYWLAMRVLMGFLASCTIAFG